MRIYHPVRVDDDTLLLNEVEHEALYAKINQLPEELQDLLFDEDTESAIASLSGQLELSSNQTADLSRLIRGVIMTEIPLGKLPTALTERVGLNQVESQLASNFIRNDILAEDLDQLEILNRQRTNSTTPTETNPNNMLNLREQDNT